MDPVMLVILAGIWLAQNFSVETKHAARGTVSPRWQRKLAKLEREGRPGYVPRYGSKDWALDLWGDFLKAKTDARRAAAWGPKGRRGAAERVRRAWRAMWPVDLGPESEARKGAPRPDPVAVESARVDDEPQPGFFRAKCVNCGGACFIEDYRPDGGPVWCMPCRTEYPQRGADPRAIPDAADASVIPIFRKKEQKESEVTTTTDTGAEAGTFLITAIEHCRAIAAAHEAHSEAGGEDFVQGLTSAGVGPKYTNMIFAAQEQSALAGEMWAAAAKAMESDGGDVRESYERNPDVGDKEHVTGGE